MVLQVELEEQVMLLLEEVVEEVVDIVMDRLL